MKYAIDYVSGDFDGFIEIEAESIARAISQFDCLWELSERRKVSPPMGLYTILSVTLLEDVNKPDIHFDVTTYLDDGGALVFSSLSGRKNLRLVFDGNTCKLKSAEVIA